MEVYLRLSIGQSNRHIHNNCLLCVAMKIHNYTALKYMPLGILKAYDNNSYLKWTQWYHSYNQKWSGKMLGNWKKICLLEN